MPASFASMDYESENRAAGNPLRFIALEKRSKFTIICRYADAFKDVAMLDYNPSSRTLPAAVGEKPLTEPGPYSPIASRPIRVPKASAALAMAFSPARPSSVVVNLPEMLTGAYSSLPTASSVWLTSSGSEGPSSAFWAASGAALLARAIATHDASIPVLSTFRLRVDLSTAGITN